MSKEVKTTKISKEKKNPKGQSIRKEFEFQLSEKERIDICEKAYEHELEASNLELQFEEAKSVWKSKIQAQLAKAGELRAKFYKKVETRTLDAILVKDYDQKEVKYYHKGKVIESRTMTPEETQVHMDELAGKKPIKVLKTRDAGKAIAEVSGKKAKSTDIADVIRMETGRKTKTSAVDGATRS